EAGGRMRGRAGGGGRWGDHGPDVEIALGRRRRPDAHGPVGEAHVQRALVGGRIDGHGLDAHLVEGADDAHGDLAAVRDQNAREHQSASSGRPVSGSRSKRTCPNSTGCAFSTWIVRTTASSSAFTSFMSFIASRMQSVWPGATTSPTSTNGRAPGCEAR